MQHFPFNCYVQFILTSFTLAVEPNRRAGTAPECIGAKIRRPVRVPD